MNQAFRAYFRSPDSAAEFRLGGTLSPQQGFFRFGESVECYGQSSAVVPAPAYHPLLEDVSRAVNVDDHEHLVTLPFDPDQLSQNLRMEAYIAQDDAERTNFGGSNVIRSIYYLGRPAFPIHFRRILQRIRLRGGTDTPFPHWPVDRTADRLFEELMKTVIRSRNGQPIPFIWFWPDGAPAAAVITHDIETEVGRDYCSQLMNIDDEFGFKSSFQVVPEERYDVPKIFLDELHRRGFEVNVHDLSHDGNLFRDREEFLQRAAKINGYLKQFRSEGFRSGALYRNLRWFDAFEFSYDMSVPNVGHLDAQPGGCCTVFPYLVGNILEIPVTVTQDYSLFHILSTYSTELWEEQCRIILDGHGLINAIIHPDYIIGKKANNAYRRLLAHLAYLREKSYVWTALPRDINNWWRTRLQLRLEFDGQEWRIQGEGRERARIAYAHLVDGRLKYSFEPPATSTDSGEEHHEFAMQSNGNNGSQPARNSVTASSSKTT
jgi:hypothetical protein